MNKATCILVVEEDPALLRRLAELLTNSGYEVLQASSGREGLKSALARRPEVTLVDVTLPDVSGVEVCRQIKGDPAMVDTFVVLMSGAATRGAQKAAGLDQGADEYLVKTADREELLARIRTIVRLQAITAALRTSERNYRQLAENIREVFWITDPAKNKTIYISPGFEEIWGRTCEEIYASPRIWLEAIHADDRERVLEAALTKQSAGTYHEEYRILRPDGSIRWIEDRAFPVHDESGKVIRVVGIADDITERKLAEKQSLAFSRLGYRLSAADTREQAAEIILETGSEVFGWDAGYVVLYSSKEDRIIPLLTVDTVGSERQRFPTTSLPSKPTPLMRRVLEQGATLIDPAKARDPALNLVPFGNVQRPAGCMMFVPIHASGAVVGLVSIQSYASRAYAQEDLNGLQMLADFCGGSLLRIEMTEALRTTEAKYREIFENVAEGIFQTTQDGRYLNANPALARMFGYQSPEDLISGVTNIERQTFVSPENAAALKERLAAQDLVQGFEAERYRKDGGKMWTSIDVRKVRDAAGSFRYYEGTVQDITLRKLAEKQRAAFSRLGYGLSGAVTPEQAANIVLEIASELFGWDAGFVHLYSKVEDKIIPVLTIDTVGGQRVLVHSETFTPDPSPLMRLVMGQGPQLYDRSQQDLDAPPFVPFGDTSRQSASMMHVPIRVGGDTFGVLSIQSYTRHAYRRADLELLQTLANYCGDTFRRIEMTEALRGAEAKYRGIFENASEGIFQSTPDGRVIAANPALARMFGYQSPEEMMSSVTQVDRQMYASPDRRAEFKQALDSQGFVQGFEMEGYRKDGGRIWVAVNARMVRDADGQAMLYEGTARDITGRKQSEEELRKLSRAVEQSPAIVVITDLAGKIEHVNAKFTEVTGYTLEEVRGRNPRLLKSGCMSREGYAQLWQTITSGREWRGEFHNRKKNGSLYWEAASISPILDPAGRITHFVAVKEDVTERKRMEKKVVAFAELGHRLSGALKAEEAAQIIMEIVGDLFDWDSGYVHLYSRAEDKIVRVLTVDTIDGRRVPTPPARQTSEPSPMMRLVMGEGPRLINRDGASPAPSKLYPFGDPDRPSASMMYVPIRAGGEVVGIMSVQSYVAGAYSEPDLHLLQALADHCGEALQRIKVSEALRAAETKYRGIFENATEGIFQSTPGGQVVGANPALARMFGYANAEEMIASVTELGRQLYVSPERRADFRRALETEGFVQGFEAENFRKDGARIWVTINARVVRDGFGRAQFYEGTIQDVTRSKKTEAILRESERKLRLISENSTDAIFAFDMDRRPVYANPAITGLTGYTFAEIKERGFINWIHPDDQDQMLKHWEGLYTGKSYSDVEFRLITKTGQTKWCASTWGPLFDEAGRQIGVQGRERDINQRKQLESEVLEISTAERRRIGHELHDGLGQYLAGIAFRAKALEQRLSAEALSHAVDAKELVTLMGQAISQARNLARGMAPVDVEVSGLAAALENLAAEASHFFNTPCVVSCADSDPHVDAQVGLELYRIAQEAIHNAIKHGVARRIDIKLNIENQSLCLQVLDDGEGFEPESRNDPGMGLRVMGYRARSIGANLKVTSQPGGGTMVRCVVPLTCLVAAPSAVE